MSNTKNLANLAAVLDDGTSGQVLQSTGSGGVQFADSSGSGVTVHANQAAMLTDAASASEGTLHYETNTNKLYVKQTSGFYLLASITNASPTIDSFSENTGGAGANNLTAGGTFTLTAGSNTVVTINATEPDLETISYSATVTSGTATDVFSSPSFPVTNQSSNVFTLTPVTSGTGGTVTIRFDASDGTNVANVSHSFEIAFVIADSHYTTLLMATDGSAGDNNDITDSSSNNHTITPYGDAHAGTFSPYRSGGYSTYFDGNDYLAVTKSTDLDLDTNNWTIECWLNLTNPSATQAVYSFGYETQTTRGCIIYLYGGNLHFAYSTTGSNNTDTSMGSHGIVANEWSHLSVVRNGSTITGYINGAALGTTINIGASDIYYPSSGSVRIGGDGTNFVTGYISDFRLVNGTATAPASGGPTERLTAVTNTKLLACHIPYFADGSSSSHSITTSGDPETKPIGPYDYDEYDESIYGGSVYFDGSGDYLSIADNADFDLGTGDFTFEAWAYPTALSYDYPSIISAHDGSASTSYIFGITNTNKMVLYGGSGGIKTSTATFPLNTWVHLMATRSSGTVRFFINGTLDTTTYTDNGSYDCPSTGLKIGQQGVGSGSTLRNFTGYLSDVRLIKGQALQTSTFDPPTAPLSAVTNTALLLKSTDAHVLDKSQGNNLKLVGTAASTSALTSGSTPPYIGAAWANTSAVSFDGDSDYVFVPASSLLDISSSDITIEGYFYTTSTSVKQGVWEFYSDDNNYARLFFEGGNGNVLRLTLTSSATQRLNATGTTTLSINTWYHIAVTRDHSSGAWKTFIDGVQDTGASGTESAAVDTSSWNFEIGRDLVATDRYWSGYMQDFRFTQGKNRYPNNNFTVPSAPLKG